MNHSLSPDSCVLPTPYAPVLPQQAAGLPAGGTTRTGQLRTSRKTRATPRARPPAPWASSSPVQPDAYRRVYGVGVHVIISLRAIDDPAIHKDGERLYVVLRVENGSVNRFSGEFTPDQETRFFEVGDFEEPSDSGRKLSQVKRGDIFFAVLFDNIASTGATGSAAFSRFATFREWVRYQDLIYGR